MLKLRFAKDYLLHRFEAKNRHGVHSPFVYRLVDEVIYDYSEKKVYAELENLRRQLIIDNKITTYASSKNTRLFYRLVAYLQPDSVVACDIDPAIIILYLRKAAPAAKIYALEPSPAKLAFTLDAFKKSGCNTIEIIEGDIDTTLPALINKLQQMDIVLINGESEMMLKYFEWCLPKVNENTLLIFNDIYRSQGAKTAWHAIKAHPQVIITIDLFWLGLVFFKAGQAKEDFLIKI